MATSTAGASALKWMTRTCAPVAVGGGLVLDDLGLDRGNRVGGGDRVVTAGRDGHIRVDDGTGRRAGRVDLDVVGTRGDAEVPGDRAERDVRQGIDLDVVEVDVDGRGIGRGVEDADHGVL